MVIEPETPLEKVTCPFCGSDQISLLGPSYVQERKERSSILYTGARLRFCCRSGDHSWTVVYRQRADQSGVERGIEDVGVQIEPKIEAIDVQIGRSS